MLDELYDRTRIWLNVIYLSVIVSNRLVTSPCAIVADTMGFTANVQKLMSTFSWCFCNAESILV